MWSLTIITHKIKSAFQNDHSKRHFEHVRYNKLQITIKYDAKCKLTSFLFICFYLIWFFFFLIHKICAGFLSFLFFFFFFLQILILFFFFSTSSAISEIKPKTKIWKYYPMPLYRNYSTIPGIFFFYFPPPKKWNWKLGMNHDNCQQCYLPFAMTSCNEPAMTTFRTFLWQFHTL